MNKQDILSVIQKHEGYFNNIKWIVTGSACSALRENHPQQVNDIDIVQLTGDRVCLNKTYHERLISFYYPSSKIDLHYINPKNMSMYPIVVQNITTSLDYCHHFYTMVEGYPVITTQGMYLANWVLHAIPGYNLKHGLVLTPEGNDKINLQKLLGNNT